jgi:hypothetical protein
MPKRHQKTARTSAKPTTPRTTPVEAVWLKFADKLRAFQQTPNNDDDKNKPWEAALNAANWAACAVIAEPATCLHDIELRIQAWGFTSSVETGDDLADLANWQPHRNEQNSEFIASLRDDVLAMKRLVLAAHVAIGSIAAPAIPDEAGHS